MPDIIQLLPDSVANQIAAGEVIQRPASVVKELVENSIDAGATHIQVNLKDAGRTLIQIIDNGMGMSPTDARMAFERHATSKIREAKDLFAIHTMGFRGEALASIAAISEVELKSRREEDELGTSLLISGSKVLGQEPVNCPVGTNFLVKNIFYNVPARRKFLKANSTELKLIITELQRISIANPEIAFTLIHNGTTIYNLAGENRRKRILSIFGKSLNQRLVNINTDTSIVKINGFIGQPKFAKKKFGEQFFFVNNRFMKHNYFHKAVMHAYEKILPPETIPSYFIFFNVDPATIDINIHPTKTEIKFEDENAIWQIIQACLREALGKFNMVPAIDFDQAGSIDIPIPPPPGSPVTTPEINLNPSYNPFEEEERMRFEGARLWSQKENVSNWENLYNGFESERDHNPTNTKSRSNQTTPKSFSDFFRDQEEEPVQQTIPSSMNKKEEQGKKFIQLKNKYILTTVKSGLMVIDQRRAHERILFDKFLKIIDNNFGASQQELFPHTMDLNAADTIILSEIQKDLHTLGFDVNQLGPHTFIINGTPAFLKKANPKALIEGILEDVRTKSIDIKEKCREELAKSLAKNSAINYGAELKQEEISELFDNLFACQTPNFSPNGKPVISILPVEDFEKKMK